MFGAIGRHPLMTTFVISFIGLGILTVDKIATLDDPQTSRRQLSGPVSVAVAAVTTRTIIDVIEALGTTRANESVDITSKVTETVRQVNFDDGMRIEAGDILVQLTNAEEKAQLAEFRANLLEAKKQYDRISGLVTRGNAATSTLDEQLALVETSQARIDAVTARLADRQIRAPFSGILGFRRVSPGTLVTPNTVITTLDDISIIKLDFPVPEVFIPSLRAGQEIHARSVAYPDHEFTGIVSTISPRVDPLTRAVMVRAKIPNEAEMLRPGMLLTVSLVKGSRVSMVIPEEALVPVQNRQYVYLTDPTNHVERRTVEIGRRRPGIVEILSGLKIGDKIVVEGMMNLRPGAEIVVVAERDNPRGAAPNDSSGLGTLGHE